MSDLPRGDESPLAVGAVTASWLLTDAPRAAIADDLMFLARLHDREPDAELIATLRATPVESWVSLRLFGSDHVLAAYLLESSLSAIALPVGGDVLDDLAAEYAAIYLTFAYQTSPAESCWRDDDGLERQGAMFAVREWYRRFGVRIPDWRKRSDDHISFELQFLAQVIRQSPDAATLDRVAQFLCEHPLAWIPAFARRAVQRCRLPFFAGITLLTSVYLEHLAAMLGLVLGRDMTPAPLKVSPSADDGLPTCADIAPKYVPGIEPSW